MSRVRFLARRYGFDALITIAAVGAALEVLPPQRDEVRDAMLWKVEGATSGAR